MQNVVCQYGVRKYAFYQESEGHGPTARGPKGTELGQFTRCNFVLETELQKIKFEQ